MALLMASASATRSRKAVRAHGVRPWKQWRAISSTAASTSATSLGIRSSTRTATARPVRAAVRRRVSRSGAVTALEAGQAVGHRGRDVEQAVELGELEQRSQIVVEPRDPELA